MIKANLERGSSLLRFILIVSFLAVTTLFFSCQKIYRYKDETLPQQLTPVAEAGFDQLVQKLKSFTDTESIRATRISMKFTDLGSSERYRGAADATLVLQRPENVRLIIQVPVTKSKLAEMVSDSKHFKVAIYYDKYKRFLLGTNNADYTKWRDKLQGKKESQSAFINARPFHFTEALLIRPLHVGETGVVYSVQEELVEEADTRSGAKKNGRVVRSFYVISETIITDKARSLGNIRRRFWFDRNNDLQLRRQQIFDDKGILVTDARYSNYIKLNLESQVLRPSVIEVRRPADKYIAELNFLPESFELNVERLPATAFVLENDQKLPETDLDKPENK